MAKQRTYVQDALLCLAGFVAGAYGGTMLTGLSQPDLPEPQQIEWRHEFDLPGLDHIVDGHAAPMPGAFSTWEARQ